MVKRELTTEEKEICNRQLGMMDEEADFFTYQMESANLLLKKGIDYKYNQLKENANKEINQLKKKVLRNKTDDLVYQLEAAELFLKGIPLKRIMEIREVSMLANKINLDLRELMLRRETTIDQVENGVEIKEETKEN